MTPLNTQPVTAKINISDLRERSIEMLNDVVQLLKQHKIFFWLDFGSLLGAVREGRSILWDGDYDLSIFDHEFDDTHVIWRELELKGYTVKINSNNLKITSNNWLIGYYKIDIHRIKKNNKSNYVYYYGNLYSKSNQFLQSVIDIITVLNPQPLVFPEFDVLTLLLLKNGVKPKDLEKIKSFKFINGPLNSPKDFTLKNDNLHVKSEYYNSLGKKFKIIFFIINICPNLIRRGLKKGIKTYLGSKKQTPYMVFEIPSSYLDHFENIKFHGISFNIPNNTESYLASLFGPDWGVPKLGHWREEEGRASGVKNFKSAL